MARKYQGYARGKGFQQRDPGYGSLSRLREQGNQAIRGLQQDRAERLRNEQQFGSDLEANFRRSQQNRAELQQFQNTVDDRADAAERRNAQTRIQNAQTEAKNSNVLYEQLSEFVPSLIEAGAKSYQAVKEVEEKAAFVTAVLNDPIETFGQSPAYAQAEDVFNQNEEAYQRIGDSMEGTISQGAIQEFRSDSPAQQKVSTENRVALAEMGIDEALTTYTDAPMQLKRLMDQYDLYNVNKVKLYNFAKKVQQRRASLFEVESKVRAKDLSFTRIQGAQNNFLANPSANTLDNLLTVTSRGTEDGVKRNGLSFAVEQVLGDDSVLANPALVDDFTFEQIVNDTNWQGGQKPGQTIAQRFGARVKLLRQKRQDQFVTDSNRIDKVEKAASANRRRELFTQMDELASSGQYDFNTISDAIRQSDMNDDDKKLAQEYNFDVSPSGQRQEKILEQINFNYNNGQSISDLVPLLRGPDLAYWTDIENKRKEAFTADGVPTDTKQLQLFTGTAKDQLGRNTTVEQDKSYITAGRDAFSMYTKRRQKYITDGMGAFDAHLKAESEVLQLITTDGGKFAIQQDTSDSPSKFKYYAPEGGYYQDIVQTNGGYALQSVVDNPEILDTTYLVSTSQIKDIYRAVQTNTPFQKPWIFQTLSENGYHDGLQRQLNKYATDNQLEPVTVPMSFDQYRSMTAPSPRVKRFMETATSPLEYKKYTLAADPTSYRNPTLMGSAVAYAYPDIKNLAIFEPILAKIRSGEGTWTSANRGRAGDTPDGVPGLDRMTADQWMDLQNNQGYFALGAYQFIPGTFKNAVKRLGLPGNTVMTPQVQGKVAIELMVGGVKRPNLAAYLNGTSNDLGAALDDLSKEWAAIASKSGKSAYEGIAGNAASISRNEMATLVQQAREMRLRGR